MVFVRFFGCPLACPWCDEPLHRDPQALRVLTTSQVLTEIRRIGPGIPDILLTGGEPLAAPGLNPLLDLLQTNGYRVAVETSGVGGPWPVQADWITLSPKTPLDPKLMLAANELKFVVGGEANPAEDAVIRDWSERHPLVWVQPRAQGRRPDPAAIRRCLDLVMTGEGRIRLSVQIHKWLGIP